MAAPVITKRRIIEHGSPGTGDTMEERIFMSSIGDVIPAVIASDLAEVDGAVVALLKAAAVFPQAVIGEVKASSVLTVTSGMNVSNGDTVTIGGKVYTFQTTLTDVDGNVDIGADDDGTAANLAAAINLGAGAGTAYAASMTKHPSVTAVAVTNAVTVTAISGIKGVGNAITISEASTNLVWAPLTTLGGGLNKNDIRVTFDAADDLAPATLIVYGRR